MIRKYEKKDLDTILTIWLDASIIAHDFIAQSYWEGKVGDMRNTYIPASDTFVYIDEQSGKVEGFISLVDNYIAAVFVEPSKQGKGIGKQLISCVKQLYDELSLGVYSENLNSVAFYEKQGFVVVEEKEEEDTKHFELVMTFKKATS